MKRYSYVSALLVTLVCAGLLGWFGGLEVSAQAQGKGKAAKAKAKGPQVLGMENGLTYFQTQCMGCHSERSTQYTSARWVSVAACG